MCQNVLELCCTVLRAEGLGLIITQRDIANRVGVSVTAIAHALGGYSDVAEATWQRILQVAGESHYYPNAAARQLRSGLTDTIGLIVPALAPCPSDPFLS